MTLISRVFGFARDMLTAVYFGASPLTDAFNVAYKLPNLLRRIFAEGAFFAGICSCFGGVQNTKTHSETQAFCCINHWYFIFCFDYGNVVWNGLCQCGNLDYGFWLYLAT